MRCINFQWEWGCGLAISLRGALALFCSVAELWVVVCHHEWWKYKGSLASEVVDTGGEVLLVWSTNGFLGKVARLSQILGVVLGVDLRAVEMMYKSFGRCTSLNFKTICSML
jgi:hypothetical protein